MVQPEDPDRQLIFIDSDAATVIYRDGSDVSKHPELRDRVEGSPTTWGAATRC